MKGYAMVNNSSKLNNLCFDTRIITFPSKAKGEFDQPNSLDLSLPGTYNRRYLTKLSVVKSDYFPFGRLLFPEQFVVIFLTTIAGFTLANLETSLSES